jgi:hypothetical protein
MNEIPETNAAGSAFGADSIPVERPRPVALQQGDILELLDREQQMLGKLVVEKVTDTRAYGDFDPTPAFANLAPLFEELVKAANETRFTDVDEIDLKVATVGLVVKTAQGIRLPLAFGDFGQGRFSFQLQ